MSQGWGAVASLVLGAVLGVFGTVFYDRVGAKWSNGTWVVLAVVTVAVASAAPAVGGSRPAVVVLAVSLGALLSVAAVKAWPLVSGNWIGTTALVVAVLASMGGVGYLVRDLWDDDEPEDACGRTPAADAVDVMVVWEGTELEAFCGVVDAYGPDVEVTSVGEDIGAALDDRFDDDDAPDVAVIPQPGLVHRYASRGLLCPTPDDVVELIPRPWNEFVTARAGAGGQRRVYGAVVKGAHKSLFWYDLDAMGDEDPGDWTWGDLVSWVEGTVDSPSFDAPLALPVENRWPLTDWFENQLAGTDPELYERLSRGERVDWDHPSIRQALEEMARLWRQAGVLAGGRRGAAGTEWSDVPRQVLEGQAALGFGPSFVAGPADDLPRNDRLWVAGFPRLDEGRPLVVGGDFAVVPTSSGDCTAATAGRDLVRWLTDEEAMQRWSRRDRGFLTPNARSPYARLEPARPGEWENVRILLTALIRQPRSGELHFDLSDDPFAVANEGDARGSWELFHAFFLDVTGDPGDLDCAIDRIADGLEAEYEGEAPGTPAC